MGWLGVGVGLVGLGGMEEESDHGWMCTVVRI